MSKQERAFYILSFLCMTIAAFVTFAAYVNELQKRKRFESDYWELRNRIQKYISETQEDERRI